MPIFNVIAAYHDDAGVYECEVEAEDYGDALRQAQTQAYEDNHGGGHDGEAYDMLDSEQSSVVDVTARYALKAEITTALREEADKLDRTRHPDITDPASERADYLRELATRFETFPVHA